MSKPIADTHWETLQKFKKLGLPVNPHTKRAKDIEKLLRFAINGIKNVPRSNTRSTALS